MKLTITIVLIALISSFAAFSGTARNGWDRENAARYLDERMDVWFVKAKKLKTSPSETSCVSCHTTIPYVLARPALRRAMHVPTATAQELRIVAEVTRRVEAFGACQPLYDHSDSKKTESRGTEAVLNALILANADAAQNRREASSITQQAFKQLWETQRSDGAWDWLDFGLEPFETKEATYFGATLAALAVGHAPKNIDTNAGAEKLRTYLQDKYAAQHLFNRTWLLLASTRWPALLTKAQRQSLVTALQRLQRDDGGWALESLGGWHWSKTEAAAKAPGTPDAALLAQSDGYATGLIVYTLRQAGVSVTHPAVRKGLQWLRANQHKFQIGEHEWTAWRAHSLNFDREHGGDKGEAWRRLFMSDSATAFAVLALLAAE